MRVRLPHSPHTTITLLAWMAASLGMPGVAPTSPDSVLFVLDVLQGPGNTFLLSALVFVVYVTLVSIAFWWMPLLW